MAPKVSIICKHGLLSIKDKKELLKLVIFTLSRFQNYYAGLSIKFVSLEEMIELNQTFRGKNYETDIISFPSDEIDPENRVRYLGDIAISYDVARKNAINGNIPVFEEIKFLVIHGILHLLGYSDDSEEGYQKMILLQKEILNVFK